MKQVTITEKDYEVCEKVNRQLANILAEIARYDWDGDYCKIQAKEILNITSAFIKETIDWSELTSESAKLLGFVHWTDPDIWLIPLYLFDAVPEDFPVTDIFGKEHKFNKDLDDDIRCGCIAYGININD